tara:strand:+ start:230 stop:496 length:267 start_codon:yes stop_codon:yes gene_type:complete
MMDWIFVVQKLRVRVHLLLVLAIKIVKINPLPVVMITMIVTTSHYPLENVVKRQKCNVRMRVESGEEQIQVATIPVRLIFGYASQIAL